MDIFNSIALPHSVEHFHLLLFILNLLTLFFVPYFALLLGATIMGVFHDMKARRRYSSDHALLAADLLAAAIPGKTQFSFFGLLPAVALIFIFAQLLQGTASVAAGVMMLGVAALLTGGIALFVFRYTGSTKVFDVVPGELGPGPAMAEPRDMSVSHRRSGTVALISMVLSAFLVGGAFALALEPDTQTGTPGLLGLVISGHAWMRLILWATIALGITGALLLFLTFSWRGGRRNTAPAYLEFVRTRGTWALTVSLLVLPLVAVAELPMHPANTLSGGMFLLVGCGLFFLLAALHAVYAFSRTGRPAYTAYALFSLLIALGLLSTKDQVVIHLATNERAAILSHVDELDMEKLRMSVGVAGPALTGEDIYNAKCSACHLFDAKKVGPPYNVVVRKYTGKKNALVSFILSPVKIDPAFPPMPAQGLKPAEADSIASYLLKKTNVLGS
jgi:cytochrome c